MSFSKFVSYITGHSKEEEECSDKLRKVGMANRLAHRINRRKMQSPISAMLKIGELERGRPPNEPLPSERGH